MKKDSKSDKKSHKEEKHNSKDKKEHVKKEKKTIKSKKKFWIIGTVLIILLIVAYFFLNNNSDNISKVAYISGINGDVKIINENGERIAKNSEEIFLDDIINTGTKSSANLVLLGKAIVSLDSNTEVEISSLFQDNIEIIQNSGSTWNKFLGLVGANSYKVKTPDAVASVRGTEFGVDVTSNSTITLVGEGKVNFGLDNETIDLIELEKAGVINKKLQRLKFTQDDKKKVIRQKVIILNNLKKIREEQIKNLGPVVNFAKKTYGLTDEDINKYLEQIDRGELNDEELIEKAPFGKKDLYRIKTINDEIKKINSEIQRLNQIEIE